MKPRYGNPDSNHHDVIGWYRELGCFVCDTKDVGFGFPDLVVGAAGVTDVVEIKSGEGRLRSSQELFISAWRGSAVRIVRTQGDVLEHVTDMRRRARRAA